MIISDGRVSVGRNGRGQRAFIARRDRARVENAVFAQLIGLKLKRQREATSVAVTASFSDCSVWVRAVRLSFGLRRKRHQLVDRILNRNTGNQASACWNASHKRSTEGLKAGFAGLNESGYETLRRSR